MARENILTRAYYLQMNLLPCVATLLMCLSAMLPSVNKLAGPAGNVRARAAVNRATNKSSRLAAFVLGICWFSHQQFHSSRPVLFILHNLSKLARNIQSVDTWCKAHCVSHIRQSQFAETPPVHNSPTSSQGSPPSSTKKSSTNWRLGDKYAHTNTKKLWESQTRHDHTLNTIDRRTCTWLLTESWWRRNLVARIWFKPGQPLVCSTVATDGKQVIHTRRTHSTYTLDVHTERRHFGRELRRHPAASAPLLPHLPKKRIIKIKY